MLGDLHAADLVAMDFVRTVGQAQRALVRVHAGELEDLRDAAGTVQLQPAWAPNQPHRADVAKLIVHRRARRRGIARALMQTLESAAYDAGYTLLLLDTCRGCDAERLYAATGWVRVGVVPGFALNPDGSICDTAFFYKQLTASK